MFENMSNIIVFKEIIIANQLFFQWFRVSEQQKLEVEATYTEQEFWERFNSCT